MILYLVTGLVLKEQPAKRKGDFGIEMTHFWFQSRRKIGKVIKVEYSKRCMTKSSWNYRDFGNFVYLCGNVRAIQKDIIVHKNYFNCRNILNRARSWKWLKWHFLGFYKYGGYRGNDHPSTNRVLVWKINELAFIINEIKSIIFFAQETVIVFPFCINVSGEKIHSAYRLLFFES